MHNSKEKALISDCDGVFVNWFSRIEDFLESKGLSSGHIANLLIENRFFDVDELFPYGEERAWELFREYNESEYIKQLDIVDSNSLEPIKEISKSLKIIVVTNLSDKPHARENRLKQLQMMFGDIFEDIVCLAPFSDKTMHLLKITMHYDVVAWIDDNAKHVREGILAGIENSFQFTAAGVKTDESLKQMPSFHHLKLWLENEGHLR